MKLIGLTGFARSGKDTVGQRLINEHGFERLAFADAVREAVFILNPTVREVNMYAIHAADRYLTVQEIVGSIGWERAKSEIPEVRRLLQVMGTEVGRNMFGECAWTEIAARKMMGMVGKNIVITDVRFENEAEFVHKLNGQVWKVERTGFGPVNAHASEALDFEVDRIVQNDSDLAALYARVDALLRSSV